MSEKDFYYSNKYTDYKYEYRHVMLPKDLAKLVPKTHLMSEAEWRNLGVQQSLGKIFVWWQSSCTDISPGMIWTVRILSVSIVDCVLH